MKIGQLEPKAVAASTKTERPATTGPAAKSDGANAEPSAQVELSAAALLAGGGDSAEFDAEKVQRIAQAIREGKYQINPEAIADKLIGNAKELLDRTSH